MRPVVFFEMPSGAGPIILIFGAVVCVISIIIWVIFCDTRSLPTRFKELGNVIGMTHDQIIEKVGQPTETATDIDGGLLIAWSTNSYAITLGFVEGKCIGVVSEQTLTPEW